MSTLTKPADRSAAVTTIAISITLPAALVERLNPDELEAAATLAAVQLATGCPAREITRRLHGWQPRDNEGL